MGVLKRKGNFTRIDTINNVVPFRFLSVQDIVSQLKRFLTAMTLFHQESEEHLKSANVFPIEVDLSAGTLGNTFNK